MVKKKITKKKDLVCKHAKLRKEGGYTYDIGDDQDIFLCPDCNMNLAGEIAKQQAIETFINTMDITDGRDC